MEDFLNRFRDNLERRPEPEFEEQDWQALQKRLDQWPGQKRRPGLFWWWLVAPLLLLSLASNGVLLHELNQANQTIDPLGTSPDTIVQTHTVYRTDTVYKTRIVREKPTDQYRPFPAARKPIASSSGEGSGMPDADTISSMDRFAASDRLPTEVGSAKGKELSAVDHRLSTALPDSAAVNREPWAVHRLPSAVDHLPSAIHLPSSTARRDATAAGLIAEVPVDAKWLDRKKSFRQHLYAGRPKGFRLGATAGGAYAFRGRDPQPLGYSLGLEAVVEFSPHLQLWGGATYFDLGFTTDRMDAALGVPLVDPPSGNLEFVQAYVPQPSLEYSIGMQYVFGTGNKIRPLLGIGFGAVSRQQHDIVYEFKNTMTGVEWKYDQEIQAAVLDPAYLVFRAGLEYKIASRWYGVLRASYRTNWERTGLLRPDILGVQTGIMVRF